MLHNLKELYGDKLAASDGAIGLIKDFYFDDRIWVIRYLVADTGTWLTERKVLLSPHALGRLDGPGRMLHVNLTRRQIEESPSIETHRPVSRQFEIDYYRYYGWPAYWEGGATWGLGGFPSMVPAGQEARAALEQPRHHDDRHLQSTAKVTGYHVESEDGPVGHVTGFLVNKKTWAIQDVVVETGHWYAGKEVLVPTERVDRISYENSMLIIDLTKADIAQTAENHIARPGPDPIETRAFVD